MTETIAVDLQERLTEIEDELDRIESEADTLEPADPEFQTLAEDYEELSNAKDTLEAKIEEYGGSEFHIKANPTWGDQNRVNDFVRSDMAEDGEGNPGAKLGSLKARMVQVYVVDTPPDAPAKPSGYPPVIGEFLYQKVEAITRFGDEGSDDFLLQRKLDETN